jgi:RHS repeat-associated protein
MMAIYILILFRILKSTLLSVILLFTSISARAQSVEYFHTDALGSPVAITDQNRIIVQKSNYAPYGELLNRASENGPGYTGHVTDAGTQLSYMQQRYYDPQLGMFLSTDPVQASNDPIVQFHRYRYASGNPYKFTDPDGRVIKFALEGGATLQDQTDTMGYLMTSSTAAADVMQLHLSEQTYTIQFERGSGEMRYREDSRTVTVDPESGLRVKSTGQIQSSALGTYHEIAHAAQHDRIGTAAYKASIESPQKSTNNPDGSVSVVAMTSKEEARATSMESRAARELGEPTRQNYRDESGSVKTCGPRSNTAC